MVHRKSCYKLTYRKVPVTSIASEYKSNSQNRNSHGERERSHHPLPFEEEECSCDEEEKEEEKREDVDQRRREKREKMKKQQSIEDRLRNEYENLRRDTEKAQKKKNQFTRSFDDVSGVDGSSGIENSHYGRKNKETFDHLAGFEPCVLCGCHYNSKSTLTDYQRLLQYGNGSERSSDRTMKKKKELDRNAEEKEELERNGNAGEKEEEKRTEDRGEKLGVMKINKKLGEIDLLPATVPHPRGEQIPKHWNSRGDRVSVEEKWRKSGSSEGIYLRNSNTCLSHSTPNVNRFSTSYQQHKQINSTKSPKNISWHTMQKQPVSGGERHLAAKVVTKGNHQRHLPVRNRAVENLVIRGKTCTICGEKW